MRTFLATAEANNLVAVASAKDKYTKDMDQVCGSAKPFLSRSILKKKHNEIKEAAITQFREVRKMGGTEYSQEYEKQLLAYIKESYAQYIKHNDDKKFCEITFRPYTCLFCSATGFLYEDDDPSINGPSRLQMLNCFNCFFGMVK
ncbi:atlastin-2-like [Strongylocentrotus purpuratus]|uniref:Guanylate-binding protein/Atlastin C-terminal domain-containing protein n=1 Tax=Strongylocentrotus purpuratus TaxID=7668 RepID=A0A7M7SVI1_STRPU|nr:atlastin-2-like [Strongylocentrotus purpuratus]